MGDSYTARFAGADADLPLRPLGELAPSCYVIAATPRSGSNLLADALRTSGGLGVPMEYLDARTAEPLLARRWGATDLPSYLAHLHARRTSVEGWLGLKVHWHQLTTFLERLAPEPWAPRRAAELRQVVEQLFPGTRWIHLSRADVVRQAVSYWRALRTGRFVAMDGAGAADALHVDDHDLEEIVRIVRSLRSWERGWSDFFDASGTQRLAVTYDSLVDDLPGAVHRIRTWLGVAPGEQPAPRTRRQSDGWTDDAVARVRARLAGLDG